MKKKIISLLLVLTMLFSALSTNIFAADEETAQTEQNDLVTNTEQINAASEATYTCTVCGGTIDVNGDRVCDLCFGELPYGGSLPTDEISKYADNVLFVSSDGKGRENDPRSAISTVTDESDNTYTKLGAPTVTPTKTDTSFQNFVRTDFSSPYQVSTLNNFEALKGKSYVISVDMLLFDTLSVQSVQVLGTMCYLKGSDGCTTLGGATIPYFLRILNGGTVQYLDASKGENAYVSTAVNVKDGNFHTFAVHHTPAGDETSPPNTYDAYVDGKLIIENVQALTALQSDQMDFTSGTLTYASDVTQITVNGAVDYIPALARTCQISDSTVKNLTADQYAWDNVKFYYSDTFFEHVHDYELTHTHDLAAATNEVSYTCKDCGLTETRTLAMSSHSEGGILTPDEVVALAGASNMLAYGESTETSPFFTGFARNSGTASAISTVVDEETGNLYVKFGAATNTGGSNDFLQHNGFNSLKKVINSGVIGNSYVATLDFMHYGNQVLTPFEIASYTRGTDDMTAAPSSGKTIVFKPLQISKDGTLQRLIAEGGTYTDIKDSNGESVVLTKGVFYTITVHHIPEDNIFDVYVNGERVASGLKAISDADSDKTTWTTSNLSGFVGTEIAMKGAASFTPGYIRTPQIASSNTKDLFAIDNVKFYRSDVNYECAHSFIGDTCEWCKAKRETVTRCEICDGHAISSDAAVISKSASIGDSIAFNAYIKLCKEAADYADSKLVLDTTAAGGSKKAEFAISELSPETEGENKGLYKLTLPLRSIDMTREITVSYEADGDTNVSPYKTTINDYLDELLATPQESAVHDLVKAMKNYGSYAQIYFTGMNGNPDDLADVLPNADLSENDRNAIDSVGVVDVADYAPVITGNAVTVTEGKLVLTSHTEMKIYFRGSNNVRAYESVSENGNVTEKSLPVYESEISGEYCVTLTEPTPATFDKAHTVIFEDGEKQTTVTLSVYSLLYLVLTSADSTEIPDSFKDLARSLYLLGEETKAYKETLGEEHMLNRKKFIFIGNSYLFWGKTVLESGAKTQEERQNDQGYFYQLCKKMGAEVDVTNWTFGGHGVGSIFSDNCSHCSYDHKSYLEDRYYDYVVISPGAESNFDTTIIKVMDFFREANPDVKFIVMGTACAYGYNSTYGDTYSYQKDLLAGFEDQGILVADWGGLIDGILKGEYTVPNATQTYSINSFIVKDGKHGTMLTGYIQSMLIYSLLTGESATSLPYDFCLDTSIREEFDADKFLSVNTTETYETNFVQIFNSEADMNGLQQLVDWVLKNKPYRND
ncbi:MAG: hypothetical protein IKB38_10730 [Clostridia bacterium]|nr:hypothetical protein [Clostridia bacterium]MBR2467389.1 hypothetical protein [Clostridia bacterium]